MNGNGITMYIPNSWDFASFVQMEKKKGLGVNKKNILDFEYF